MTETDTARPATKMITPQIPRELADWLEDEAVRRSRAAGKRVSQTQLVVEALEALRATTNGK